MRPEDLSEGFQPFPVVPLLTGHPRLQGVPVPGSAGWRTQTLRNNQNPFKKGKAIWGFKGLNPYFLCCSSGFAAIRMKDF